jgi:hypothetical protein
MIKGEIMDSQEIKFISNRFWQSDRTNTKPSSASKTMPEWYTKAERFITNPDTGEYYQDQDGGKISSWKACMPFMDAMMTGYFMYTPCDIEFYLDEQGDIRHKINDNKNESFCNERTPMLGFYQPDGYYLNHFAWFIDWGTILPSGYSALYTTPFNRFDLPFINTSGVIDNDVVNLNGNLPFFLREGWTGVIPKGTPFVQIFPFKRENWKSSIVIEDPMVIPQKNIDNAAKYRIPDGGVYKNVDWHRRSYE